MNEKHYGAAEYLSLIDFCCKRKPDIITKRIKAIFSYII